MVPIEWFFGRRQSGLSHVLPIAYDGRSYFLSKSIFLKRHSAVTFFTSLVYPGLSLRSKLVNVLLILNDGMTSSTIVYSGILLLDRSITLKYSSESMNLANASAVYAPSLLYFR